MNEPSEFDVLKDPVTEEPVIESQIEEDPLERQKSLIERVKLKNKLMRYKELFPHMLKHYTLDLKDLEALDTQQLQFLLEEVSIAVNTRNSAGLTKMVNFESIMMVEKVSPMVGLKINGLAAALNENQAVHDVLNELSLKYESDLYMQPEIRLGYLTLTSIFSLHKLNSSAVVVKDYLKEKVNKETAKRFDDL